MTKLEQLKALEKGRTAGPWPKEPGYGPDEDAGDWVIGAIGPSHRFLINDDDSYLEERPTNILSEAEARKRAEVDQAFICALVNSAADLIAVAEAARALSKTTIRFNMDLSGAPTPFECSDLERLKAALARLEGRDE